MEEGRKVVFTFIDYADAFSSIDQTYSTIMILKLRSAGVSAKVCRLIRDISTSAQGKVSLRTSEGIKYAEPKRRATSGAHRCLSWV